MKHSDKIKWMQNYCNASGLTLTLDGECGFGRECVGVVFDGKYPDYTWYNDETYERIDPNGEVWTPQDAYHKHDCVAVLGRGKEAESQLYNWLLWFNNNGFLIETGKREVDEDDFIAALLSRGTWVRFVRQV